MTNINKIIENADEAYYAADYEKAIRLYQQALEFDADNEHARKQLKKAQINRSSHGVGIQDLPVEALQNYKRSRSFIKAGDLAEARKLLQQAIEISDLAGVDFVNAKDLLANIKKAQKAEEYKQKAFNEIDTEEWAKAVNNLEDAIGLDPTDETTQALLSQLKDLLKAQSMVNELQAGNVQIWRRSSVVKEIKRIIKATGEVTALIKLWQDVVKLFGGYNQQSAVLREILLVLISVTSVLLITFWALFSYPRYREIRIDCASVAPGLNAKLNYPYYVSNGDGDKIEIRFLNNGKSNITTSLVIDFSNTANIVPAASNKIDLEELSPGEERLVVFEFLVDGVNRRTLGPKFVNFNVETCSPLTPYTPKDIFVAIAPIPYLDRIIGILGGSGVFAAIGIFFRQKIINYIFNRDTANQKNSKA